MTTPASAGAPAAAPRPPVSSVLAQAWATLRRPRVAFAAVATRPRAGGMLALVTVLTVAPGTLFMATTTGRVALVDELERTATALGREVTDADYSRLRSLSRHAPWYGAARGLLIGPATVVIAGALLHLTVGRGRDEGRALARSIAVAAHAALPLGVREAVAAPVNYVKESTTNAFTIGAWMPSFDAASAAARVLGALDLFVIWSALLLALGTSVVFGRRARPVALALLGVYVVVAVLLAVVLARAARIA